MDLNMKKQNKVCAYPFTFIELRSDGNVYPCCPGWALLPFGNIYLQPFDEIWNGEKAREFRRSVLDGSYKYCDFTRCKVHLDGKDHNLNIQVMYDKYEIKKREYAEIMDNYPEIINFGLDDSCNVRCIMCRDHQIHKSSEEIKKLDSMVEDVFVPMCKNAKHVICSPSGELFSSKISRIFVKSIVKSYPNIKFTVRTNGLLCDKKNCNDLGIMGGGGGGFKILLLHKTPPPNVNIKKF
jgi:MoaA/NifB/PqqE/SkfB family radical SAM enzyme